MSAGRGRIAGLRSLDPVRPGLGFRGGKTAVPALRSPSLWRRALARDSMLRHVDWILILAVLGLSLLGTLLVWSATAPGLSQAGADPHTYLNKQLLVVVIGLIVMAGVSLIDYRVLRMIAPFAYAVGCLSLLAVLSPLGTTVLGSHSWIPLPGGFQIEPSEYAKIGLIMMIALVFGAAGERSERPGTRSLALQAKIAIGSGGMFGQGLFHGQLTAGSFLGSYSFSGTDFIFAVAGEELGFVGCATIVVLLGLVIFRAVRIAARADDAFGLLVAGGVAIWFAVQAFINIGMTIGIAPVTGLPLPFVSYGGSALFADMIAIGLLQSIHRRHRVFS
jgi:cell division protein FtsW (lipid II flippase)